MRKIHHSLMYATMTPTTANTGTVNNAYEMDHPWEANHHDQRPAAPIPFDDVLEEIGFGRTQLELIVLCGVIMMAIICETMGVSVILPAAKCDLELTAAIQGLLGGATFLGIMVSSYCWGYLSDTRGRRLVMQYALFATTACAVASSFANDFWSMLVLRLLAGVCASAPSATVYAYLGEFCSPPMRAQVISYASVWASVAMVYIALLGWWILQYDWSWPISTQYRISPWRFLFVIYTLPGLGAGLAFGWFPESAKFYLATGHSDRALDVLRHCYHKNRGSLTGFAVSVLQEEQGSFDASQGILSSLWQQTVPLMRWPTALYFTVCCLQQMSAFAVYGGLGLWYPELMNQVSSSDHVLTVCSIVEQTQSLNLTFAQESCTARINNETFLYILIMGAFGAVCSISVSLLLGKFNPKIMVVANFTIAAAAGITMLFVANRYLIVLLFCTDVILAGFSMILVNGTAVSIFPTQVCAMAVSLSMMMARLSSFIFSSVIGFFIVDHCEATFYLFSGILIFGAALTVLLPR